MGRIVSECGLAGGDNTVSSGDAHPAVVPLATP